MTTDRILSYGAEPRSPQTAPGRGVQMLSWILLGMGIVACFVLYPNSPLFNPALPFSRQHRFIFEDDSLRERILLFVAIVLSMLPATRRRIAVALDWLREPSAIARRTIATAIFLFSGPLLYTLAAVRNRLMWPIWHDEGMYRLQTTFLAHGKLVMPPLPLPDFFDAPYVFVRQCYAPVYFPGTAILHVPAALLHLPYVVTPLIIAATILTLLYLIVTELIDGLSGLLAVLLMMSLVLFRWLALTEMSHPAGAMFGLMVIWSWLRWRQSPRLRWVALAGIAAGWYAITRPLDSLCVLTPIALAWAWDLTRVPRVVKVKSVLVAVCCIAPFFTLQLGFDRALTGRWLTAPLDVYNHDYLNVKSLGLQKYDPAFVPPTPSKQIQDVYWWGNEKQIKDFTTVAHAARQWVVFRLPTSLGVGLPSLLLVTLMPISVLGLRDRQRLAFWIVYWCYMLGSACFYLFAQQYVLAIAPAIIFTVLLGADAVRRTMPMNGMMAVFLPLAIFAIASQRICLNEQGAYNLNEPRTVLQFNYEVIPKTAKLPALVMCAYDSAEIAPLQEPVYNWDVLWPDDAPIIRAHDFGPRNIELYRHYARTQPNRNVYLFDHMNRVFKPLGLVKDLAAEQH